MNGSFFKHFTVMALIFALATAVAFIAGGYHLAAAGVMVGASWLFVNLFMMARLLEMGVDLRHKNVGGLVLWRGRWGKSASF